MVGGSLPVMPNFVYRVLAVDPIAGSCEKLIMTASQAQPAMSAAARRLLFQSGIFLTLHLKGGTFPAIRHEVLVL